MRKRHAGAALHVCRASDFGFRFLLPSPAIDRSAAGNATFEVQVDRTMIDRTMNRTLRMEMAEAADNRCHLLRFSLLPQRAPVENAFADSHPTNLRRAAMVIACMGASLSMAIGCGAVECDRLGRQPEESNTTMPQSFGGATSPSAMTIPRSESRGHSALDGPGVFSPGVFRQLFQGGIKLIDHGVELVSVNEIS